MYYKTYTSFKGAKIQIYFYNKKLFFEFFIPRAIWNGGEFEMGANLEWGQFVTWVIWNGGDLRENTRNSIGRFAMGAIWNEGELQFAPTTHAKEPIPCP